MAPASARLRSLFLEAGNMLVFCTYEWTGAPIKNWRSGRHAGQKVDAVYSHNWPVRIPVQLYRRCNWVVISELLIADSLSTTGAGLVDGQHKLSL